MTHQPQKPQPPRQPTQDFESLRREQRIISVVTLCGDVINGHIVWVDLIGFQFKCVDNVNHYFPRRNFQSINWV